MAIILACANHKGGVGKTTTVINLGACFARNNRILCIDFDPQGGLTSGLGFDPGNFDTTIYHAIIKKNQITQVIIPTQIPHMDLAPSNLDLSGAEIELHGLGFEKHLRRIIQSINSAYEYILIDCPPSLGVLTVNALVAAQIMLVPLQCEYLALKALKQLQIIVEMVREEANPELQMYILRTMFDRRTLHAKEISEEIEAIVQQQLIDAYMLRTIIKRTVKIADATIGGKSILDYAGNSEAAGSYRQIAKEIENGTGIR